MSMKELELLRAACCIAGLDGEVTEREREAIDTLAKRAGVGTASLEAMIDMAKSDESFFEDQFGMLLSDPEDAIRTLWKVAAVDQRISTNERIILHHFGKKLGLDDGRVDEIIAETRAKLEKRAGRDARPEV